QLLTHSGARSDRWLSAINAISMPRIVGAARVTPMTRAELLESPGSGCADRGASAMQAPIAYLHPDLPAGLERVTMRVVDATPSTLQGYGCLVDDAAAQPIEIVRWPSIGQRPVDAGTGDQGGTTEGVFVSEWRGDILYGRNEAVDGHYILAYAVPPEHA